MSDIPSEYLETAATVVMGSKAKVEYGGPEDVDTMIGDVASAIFKAKGFDLYVVWSNEHRMWWRPQSAGYTRKISEAGHYYRDEAIAIAKGARDGWKGGYPDEIAIPLDDAEAMSGER